MKRRFSRTDWLDLGLKRLASDGVAALKLDRMCAAASLTKGSFYHHFEDHQTFLDGLAERWVTISTDALIGALDETDSSHRKNEKLSELALLIDFQLEIGIRELARQNASVRDTVRACDAKRIGVLGSIYADKFWISAEDARFAAFIEYAAFLGTVLIDPDMETNAQRALSDRFEDMLRVYFSQQ